MLSGRRLDRKNNRENFILFDCASGTRGGVLKDTSLSVPSSSTGWRLAEGVLAL